MAEKKIVDIADFFTTTNEKEGVWYELKARDSEGNPVGTGIEVLLLGYASDENAISAEVYRKEKELSDKEKDPIKKNKMEIDSVCKRIGAVIKDIRAKDGHEMLIHGEPLKYSPEIIRKILYESIDIRTDVFKATFNDANFMTKKD